MTVGPRMDFGGNVSTDFHRKVCESCNGAGTVVCDACYGTGENPYS